VEYERNAARLSTGTGLSCSLLSIPQASSETRKMSITLSGTLNDSAKSLLSAASHTSEQSTTRL
jgi:hypothetical protein